MVESLVFIIGTIFGSAGNAIIDRLPRRESWFKGRSHCDKCQHELSGLDLIPVVSYLFLGGKCRYCHSPIPVRNLVVELFMGLGFVVIYNLQFTIYNYLILWITVIIAVMDWETKLVSDVMVIIWGLLVALGFGFNVPGGLIGITVIGGLWTVTRGRAMGSGDIGIAAVMGLWLGPQRVAIGLLLAFVVGAGYGLILMAAKKAKLKSEIAFGPFLIFAAWIAYLWGDNIWLLLYG